MARQERCNQVNMPNFFIKFGYLLINTDKKLLFNCDETSSTSSKKKYKSLLLSPKDLATTVVMPSEPHISALFCYNSNGYKLNPFIIIPNLKNLPEELIYLRAFFSSQKSG